MKHVKAACILQTLVFAQNDDCGLTRELNHDDVIRYKATMGRSRTRYQITEETEQATALCWSASASSITTKLT